MSKEPEAAWFKMSGALKYTNASRSILYIKLKKGELEGRKLGKSLYISRESLDRMMESLPKFGEAA